MLESFYVVATGWLLSAAAYTARLEQIAADEAVLKNAVVASDNASLLAFVKKRALADEDRAQVHKLIRQLGAETYRQREQALADLIRRGPAIVTLLRDAANDSDLEIKRRVEKCLAVIQERDVPADVVPAVIRLLVARKTPGAVEAVLGYVPFADNDPARDEARALLALLAKQDGQAHPALVAGLTDALPARRAAAGEALCRPDLADQKAAVRKLLADDDPLVRLRVAMACIKAGDREGVPVLINTLPALSLSHAWQAEDMLFRLADGHSPPPVPLGTDSESRSKCRLAWLDWWRDHANKVDLAKLHERPQLLGYTLVVLLDMGRVMELGRDNQVRWQIENLSFPLDAQLLPDGRVLVAEYNGGRVTERDLKGQVVWERPVDGPLVAQRLPGGNTFIAAEYHVQEVDRNGKVIFSFAMPAGDRIMKAMKLPDGQVVCLTSDLRGLRDARIVRYDTTGKELFGFKVDLGTKLSGGRIYMLPDGHVLMPHNAEDKVVEYDGRGKAVWEVAVEMPVAAVRLPNGNTLVTTMSPQRGAVEFDRNGREVWSYRTTTRVTRALRR